MLVVGIDMSAKSLGLITKLVCKIDHTNHIFAHYKYKSSDQLTCFIENLSYITRPFTNLP